jgi:hypothetical protein
VSASPTFREGVASLEKLYRTNRVIRAVNFHNTSQARAAQYDRELAYYSQLFCSVNEDELDEYVATGTWRKPRPGLIIAVYEGYRNGYDVLAPLLDRHGFIGWFFVVTGFVNSAVADQLSFSEGHCIRMQTREYPDGRYALTWDELRELDRKHVIASHTRSHTQLSTLGITTLEREIIGAQEDLEEHLGHKVRAFSSFKGPAFGENPSVDRLVLEAGYNFVFSNFRIQRVSARDNHNNFGQSS